MTLKLSVLKDTDEEQVMHPKSDNIEAMTYVNVNKVIK